ncbi:MAG: Ig-like domain-containing protein [Bacteroidales bacterium]|nr:Ig-like domain-containing protein [Bacteroidales bacterium]
MTSYDTIYRTVRALALPLLAFLLASCAKQGMPGGGPKDVTPPKVKSITPENRTLNFNGNRFYIEFDEYVVVKNAENNVIVSPPLKNRAEYKTKGKGVMVTLHDTLSPNTTYLFQFKEAIADFNEGNLLPSMEYVFSTGDYVDSMSVRGKVSDALLLSPREETVTVWLYETSKYDDLIASLNDTAVKAPLPDYVTRCDKQGLFSFNSIKPGHYRVVAIQDEDKNTKIGADESVGFSADVFESHNMRDSVMVDSTLRCAADEKTADIFIFTPDQKGVQRLTSSAFVAQGKIRVTSLLPMVNPSLYAGSEQLRFRMNSTSDTMTVWTLREKCDSLQLVVSDPSGIQDTLNLRWRVKRTRDKNIALSSNGDGMSLSSKSPAYFDTMSLRFSTPMDIAKCKTDSVVSIMDMKDSSMCFCGVYFDSTEMNARIEFTLRQGAKYDISVTRGSFVDIYGHANDSLRTTITVSSKEDYGNINLHVVSDNTSALIVQLTNEKGDIVRQRQLESGGDAVFLNLTPAKYRVRVVVDSNGNGRWDTGDIKLQRLPERVVYIPQTINVRANWDFEETITIE